MAAACLLTGLSIPYQGASEVRAAVGVIAPPVSTGASKTLVLISDAPTIHRGWQVVASPPP